MSADEDDTFEETAGEAGKDDIYDEEGMEELEEDDEISANEEAFMKGYKDAEVKKKKKKVLSADDDDLVDLEGEEENRDKTPDEEEPMPVEHEETEASDDE